MRVLLACLLLLGAGVPPAAIARDPCEALAGQRNAPDVATRIAAHACWENHQWHRPFIDADGRLAQQKVTEAENARLADGVEAWRRVATYWAESGTLAAAMARPGASECQYSLTSRSAAPSCKAFIVDTPWSAAFISWVMRRAAVPGFNGSASHVNYVRAAYRDAQNNAYRVSDPQAAKPKMGDLLCYVRVARIYGFSGLADILASRDDGLAMHCDAVVGVQLGAAPMAYLVGGNVFDGVTLRMLPLSPNGYLQLPLRTGAEGECSASEPGNCSLNRQDWAVLLQLRPPEELATLLPAPAPLDVPGQPAAPQCCVNCVVGSGVPRCATVPPAVPGPSAVPTANPDPAKQVSEPRIRP